MSGRLLGVLLALAALVAGAAVLLVREEGDEGRRVDVVFDSARGIQPGSAVKVAGARVGEVREIRLTPERRALVELRLDAGTAVPAFRTDARCAIRPEGLIAESFVRCEPGTRAAPLLRGVAGRPPTLPVGRTSRPVSLADLLNLWSLPTGERARVLLVQLGLGLGGRGDDLRAILDRSLPSLAAGRRLLAAVDRQRAGLRRAVDQTATAAAVLADRRATLADLSRSGSAVAARVARQRRPLADGVRRLPPLLAQAGPALRDLDRLTAASGPLLEAAERSAPGIVRLTRRAAPLARRAGAAIDDLDGPLGRLRRATTTLGPLLPVAARDLQAMTPSIRDSDRALGALRDGGFFEGLWGFLYRGGSALSRFDARGHLLGGNIVISRCSLSSGIAVEGCSAWLRDDPGAIEPAATRRAGR